MWNHSLYPVRLEQRPVCTRCKTGTSGKLQNPNSLVYAKYLSWKVAQGALESIVKASRGVRSSCSLVKSTLKNCEIEWTHYFWKKRNSKKMRSGKRKTWTSYVKFPGVLMVKKPTDEKYKVFDCDSWNSLLLLWYTDVQFSWVRCWWVWGCWMFLRDIQSVHLNACGSLRFVPRCQSCWHFELGGFVHALVKQR